MPSAKECTVVSGVVFEMQQSERRRDEGPTLESARGGFGSGKKK